MTHETLEPSFGTSSSIMTIGIVVDIHDDHTIDVTVGDDLHENIPVFYHCQSNKDTEHGVYAFSIGDSAMILHKDAIDFTNAVIIGFGDAELRLCRPPLIVGGYIDPSFDKQTIGKCFAWYDGNEIKASSIEPWWIHTEHTFFQVRYRKIPVSFNKIEIVDNEEVSTVVTHNMIVSLAIHKGYILEEGPGDTIKNTVVVTFFDTDVFNVYRKVFSIDQSGLVNTCSFSANFTEDFKTLYLVYSTQPEILPEPPESNISIKRITWSVADNAEEIIWSIDSDDITPEFYCKYAYVDREHTIWGLYYTYVDDDGLLKYVCRSLDVRTLELSETNKISAGYTIEDGDFCGIFESHDSRKPQNYNVSSGNLDNQYCIGQSEFTLIDDGLQLVDNTDGNCEGYPTMECVGCPSDVEGCFKSFSISQSWRYWYQQDYMADYSDIYIEDIQVGNLHFKAETGQTVYFEIDTSSSPTYAWHASCGCAPSTCVTIATTIDVYNEYHSINTTESLSVLGGAVYKFQDGFREDRYNERNEPCVGECVCSTPDILTMVIDCGCRYTPGSVSSYIGYNPSYYQCIFRDIEIDYADARTDIKHPKKIRNAQPISSSRAVDTNTGGLDITRLDYYQFSEDGESYTYERILEIDGEEKSSEVYSVTKFSAGNFQFIGFYF